MRARYKELLRQITQGQSYFRDLHIIRFHSCFAAISKERVIAITKPYLRYCPLARIFYKDLKGCDVEELQAKVKKSIEEKIEKLGHFSGRRKFITDKIIVPYGASEMLMYALAKAAVQTSVVVCEGAGTVVVSKPELVQGIGGRMNSLFFTTPMKIIRERLHSHGAVLVSDQAKIDQLAGVKKAAALGYHQIAVTVNASMDESFKQLRKIEKNNNLSLVILAICTTGVSRSRLQQIKEYADLTWSCANSDLKAMVGKEAILQISRKIPVFVLTKKGLDFVSAYSDNRQLLNSLNPDKQYLINSEDGSLSFNMARSPVYLKEAKLPVDDSDSPKLTA